MAARYFYVSSVVGTNTGTTDTSSASILTTSFAAMTASNVYDTLGRALGVTTPPTDGDIIFVADNHNASYDNLGDPQVNPNGAIDGVGLQIISVDNTAANVYSPGASDELTDAGDDYDFNYNGLIAGVSLKCNDNVLSFVGVPRYWVFRDLTLSANSGTDFFVYVTTDGVHVTFVNVNLNQHGASKINHAFYLSKSASMEWYGGSITANNNIDYLLSDYVGKDGGFNGLIKGVDLSNVTLGIWDCDAASTIDNVEIIVQDCTLDASLTSLHTTLYFPNHRVSVYNSDQTSTDDYHRFYVATGSGTARNADGVYVTNNQPFNGSADKASIQVRTTSRCSHVKPFIFEMPVKYAELSSASTDKISVNIVTDFTLNDDDIYFSLIYPDGTTNVSANVVETNYNPIISNVTEHNKTGALVAGDWTGEPTSPLFYLIELDTSTDAGADCAPILRVEVYKPSILGTTGSYLYIDPILAVGT